MPKKWKYWNEEEEDAIRAGMSWEEFDENFPGRTKDSWRLKRQHIGVSRTPIVRDDERSSVSITVAPPAEEIDLEELWSSLEKVQDAREGLGRSQESTTFTCEDELPIGIAFLGDVHIGASGVDYQRFRLDLDTINETNGLYVVGMGDYTENVKTLSKAAPALWSGLFNSPEEQLGYFVTRMSIIKGSIICLAQGNHDAWDGRFAGLDRLPALAQKLECAYFTERGGSIIVKLPGQKYVITVRHNHRGNSQINKSNPQRRLFDEWPWEWENSDVVCLAHTHEPILEQVQRKGRTVTYLRSGTYKYLHDDWAERNGYRPQYGVPMTILYPRERRIVAFHGENFDDAVAYLKAAREYGI